MTGAECKRGGNGGGAIAEGGAAGRGTKARVVLRDKKGTLSGKASTEALSQAHQSGIPVEGQVKAINSGGFEVKVGGVRVQVKGPTEWISQRRQNRAA